MPPNNNSRSVSILLGYSYLYCPFGEDPPALGLAPARALAAALAAALAPASAAALAPAPVVALALAPPACSYIPLIQYIF